MCYDSRSIKVRLYYVPISIIAQQSVLQMYNLPCGQPMIHCSAVHLLSEPRDHSGIY